MLTSLFQKEVMKIASFCRVVDSGAIIEVNLSGSDLILQKAVNSHTVLQNQSFRNGNLKIYCRFTHSVSFI